MFDLISVELERTVSRDDPQHPFSLKMALPRGNDPVFHSPPCIVFIDEVHGLARNLRDELLKAIESKDRVLAVEFGWKLDCKDVCWVVATTERGKLFGPFDSRFAKVELDMYGTDEIAAIVQMDNPTWNMPLCRLAARYCNRIPREALDFAKAMVQERDMNGGEWEEVAARVARSLKIDCYGLSRKRLNVLVALGQVGAVSQGRLAHYAQCELEELVRFQMPALLIATPEYPALAVVTPKGYAITKYGLKELERRHIPHRGAEVVAEGGQRLDYGDWNPDDFAGKKHVPVAVQADTYANMKPEAVEPEPDPEPPEIVEEGQERPKGLLRLAIDGWTGKKRK